MRSQPSQGVSAFVAALSLLVIAVFPQPAAAKSLFESIFGFLNTQQAPQRPSTIISPIPSEIDRTNPFDGERRRQSLQPSYGGRYRTVCVRLCDGYYFPISNSSSRRDFYKDSQQCQSQCQSDTRLYYMSPNAPSIKQARDQRGLSYSNLKTAFLYRKKLNKSCSCRPAPWSISERMRHKTYAPANQKVVAGLAPENRSASNGAIIAAQPGMVAERGMTNTSLFPRTPAPREARRSIAHRQPSHQLVRSNRRRAKNQSWGLGESFASGLPKVKYRHNWSND